MSGVFIAPYKLTVNPFASDQPRPLFESSSVSELMIALDALIQGRHQSVLISGLAGVGKTQTIRSWNSEQRAEFSVVWAGGRGQDRTSFWQRVLADLGLTAIEGSPEELRHIVEVFLGHQASQNRRTVIIADALETMPAPILPEFEWLSQLRLRGMPVVNLVLASRDAGLLRGLMPEFADHRAGHGHVYHPLSGFTLEETAQYVSLCLRSVGCSAAEDLFSEDILREVHGYSRGIVGDTNALCALALEMVSLQTTSISDRPAVTRAILKRAAQRLNLAFDPASLQQLEAPLSPASVQQSNPTVRPQDPARLVVASGGRVVTEISLTRPRMVLGRDPGCDISLDSRYVSRYQNLFMETARGWWLLDLHSTNGSYVNGRRVREHRLRDGDVIAVGRHQLRFLNVKDQRDTAEPLTKQATTADRTASFNIGQVLPESQPDAGQP